MEWVCNEHAGNLTITWLPPQSPPNPNNPNPLPENRGPAH
jgi:hypothetical protein